MGIAVWPLCTPVTLQVGYQTSPITMMMEGNLHSYPHHEYFCTTDEYGSEEHDHEPLCSAVHIDWSV